MRSIPLLFVVLLCSHALAGEMLTENSAGKKKQNEANEACKLIVNEQEAASKTLLPSDSRQIYVEECAKLLSDEKRGCSQSELANFRDISTLNQEVIEAAKRNDLVNVEICEVKSEMLDLAAERLGNAMKGVPTKKDFESRLDLSGKKEQATKEKQREYSKKLENFKTRLENLEKKATQTKQCRIAMVVVTQTIDKALIDAGASFRTYYPVVQ